MCGRGQVPARAGRLLCGGWGLAKGPLSVEERSGEQWRPARPPERSLEILEHRRCPTLISHKAACPRIDHQTKDGLVFVCADARLLVSPAHFLPACMHPFCSFVTWLASTSSQHSVTTMHARMAGMSLTDNLLPFSWPEGPKIAAPEGT